MDTFGNISNTKNLVDRYFGRSVDICCDTMAIGTRDSMDNLKIFINSSGQKNKSNYADALFRYEVADTIQIYLNTPTELNVIHDHLLSAIEYDCLINLVAVPILFSFHNYGFMHASAVCKEGDAILFAGNKCAGKTTIARYFIEQGYQLLSDDLTGFKSVGDATIVYSGNCEQRLRPEAFQYYKQKISWLQDYTPEIQRCILADQTVDIRYLLKDQINNNEYQAKMQRIFIIEKGDQYKIELLNRNEAYKNILKHYSPSVKKYCPQIVFNQIHTMLKNVKVCKLNVPNDLSVLNQIYQDIALL